MELQVSNNMPDLLQPAQGLLARGFELFCRTLFTCYCPLVAHHRHLLPTGSFMLCSNHCSHMDAVALMFASGLPFSRLASVAAKDYFFPDAKKPSFSSRLLTLVPLDRSASLRDLGNTVALCRDFTIGNQGSLIMFPGGTRSLDGEIQSFKKGATMLAWQLGIPIVPAYIAGTYLTLPKGRSWIKPGRVQVYFGEPIVAQVAGLNLNDDFKEVLDSCSEVTGQVRRAIINLKEIYDE